MDSKWRNIFNRMPSKKYSLDVVLWLFKQLNIEYKEEDTTDNVVTYVFTYQNVNFHVSCQKDGYLAFLNFYYIFSEQYEYRYAIYYLCNKLNRDYHQSTFFYSYDEEENQSSVHLKSSLWLDQKDAENKDSFTNKLGEFFMLRRYFYEEFWNIRKVLERNKGIDVFDESNKEARSRYLMLEQEISKGHYSVVRTDFQHLVLTPYDLFSLSGKFLPADQVKKISFVSVHHFMKEIAVEEYTTFNIASLIRDLRGENPEEEHREFIVSVSCVDGTFYTASFVWQSESKASDYFLLSIENPYVIKKSSMENSSDAPLRMVYVLDKSKSNNEAEAKFMINDALDKAKDGKYDELTEEQLILVDFAGWSITEDMYWGYKDFSEKSYFQAIKHFENVISSVHPLLDTLNKKQKTELMGVYTRLGFSYVELKVYSKALYYLEIPYTYGNIDGCMEYINCLIGSNDFRALSVVETQLNAIIEKLRDYDEEEEMPEDYIDYRNFLLRRRAYLLIEKNRLDEAEKLLNRMLKEEDAVMLKFAEEKLKFIKEKRLKESEAKKENEKGKDLGKDK